MRLVKQTTLYFREGNSDKVYEISLCDVGAEKYVVNFRYGRRGAQLKEGTKTASPVSLTEAQGIYAAVEAEKLAKGYTSEAGAPDRPAVAAFRLEASPVSPAAVNAWNALLDGRDKAILRRLHQAVSGGGTVQATPWKLSRVIWKAGEYRIKEATPYILQLFNNGDAMQQYSCTWALARCRQDDAVPALQAIYSNGSALLSKIAGAGLLMVLRGADKEQHVSTYLKALPEAFQPLVAAGDKTELEALLTAQLAEKQISHPWLETLYLLGMEQGWLKPIVKKLLQQVPMRPGYFKHIRAVFKLAELMGDYDMVGMLSCRVEREEQFFTHRYPASVATRREVRIDGINDRVHLSKEFRKPDSRLAYSNKTRWYLHRRTLRRLKLLGESGSQEYVKLATALLLSYQRAIDFQEHYTSYKYEYRDRRYERIELRFPASAKAVYMHQILSGQHPALELVSGKIWRIKNLPAQTAKGTAGNTIRRITPAADNEGGLGGLVKKLTGIFGRKKAAPLPAMEPVTPASEATAPDTLRPEENGTPYLHLWNALPQAYIQLLMQAQMDEMHQFAIENLSVHPELPAIKARLDEAACRQLLLAPYAAPAAFGFALVLEKYAGEVPGPALVMAMLNSVHIPAQDKGREWAEAYKASLLQQADFITDLLLIRQEAVHIWAKGFLAEGIAGDTLRQAVAGKMIVHLLSLTKEDGRQEVWLKQIADLAFQLLGEELTHISATVVADMLQHEAPGVLLFGLRLLKANRQADHWKHLPDEFIYTLLTHAYQPVREEGVSLLWSMEAEALLQKQELLLTACLSLYPDVRKGIRPVWGRVAAADKQAGIRAANTLLPYLLRREAVEGLQEDIGLLLCHELSECLTEVDRVKALDLLYSTFSAAQNVGALILEKYTDPALLTLPQVIALGNHENLSVREWSWRFYTTQLPRIRYEKETAIKLLDSKWQDTRQFAIQYFREQFREEDWSPEILITLADSVKPEIEGFGRELITRFFTEENGIQYLLKLSQHPSDKMQLFATNYLERFAANDLEKIQSLEFYFRSVLTRVNKGRTAKKRIYAFLQQQGVQSVAAAAVVSDILSDISATAAIGDKASCIEILSQLTELYPVATPLKVKATETRIY